MTIPRKSRVRQENISISIRKETVRFDSFRFQTFRKLIGSVRFGSEMYFSPVRRGLACIFRTRRGSVRFGSVPRPVPAGSGIKRFGSVRFGRFGSVSHSFLSLVPPGSRRGASCMFCKQTVREKARIAYSHLLGDSLLCDHSRSSMCICAPSMCVLSV